MPAPRARAAYYRAAAIVTTLLLLLTLTQALAGRASAAAATVEGRVRLVAADTIDPVRDPHFTGHSDDVYRTVLVTPARTYQLKGIGARKARPNTRARVSGTVSGNSIDVTSVDVVSPAASGPSSTGTTKILVMLVTWPGLVPDSVTPASAAQQMFTDSSNWYRDTSYQALRQSGDVTPWMQIAGPTNNKCYADGSNTMDQAKAAAAAAGYDISAYDDFVTYFPYAGGLSGADCSGYAGWAYVGAQNVWINGHMDRRATVHELGHNYGLYHSHSYMCPGGGVSATGCTFADYGDDFDAMGSSSNVGGFNSSQKSLLSWMGSRSIDLTAGGSTTLVPLAEQSAATHSAYITVSSSRTYWLEYRQALGSDGWLPSYGTDGVLVHVRDDALMRAADPALWSTDTGAGLLDVRPSDGTDVTTASLRAGESWTTPEGRTIAVDTVSASGAQVTVRQAVTVPGAPSGVKATAGNASASVSWTAPASDGGSTITGYKVVASPGGTSASVAGSARSATVSGLTNGTAYSFTVTATNAVGMGPASAASNTVTPTSNTTVINESFTTSAANFTKVSGGMWAVSNGRYVLSTPASPSSSTVANANLSVHNTAVTSDFVLTTTASTTATTSAWNDFSVIFGYRDANNYDYVSFSESNDGATSGIFRVAGGVRTQLADITSTITAGTLYPVRIERAGTAIRAYRSGTLVASTTDSAFTTGKVGFGTNNDGATYDDLVVTGTQAAVTAPGAPTATKAAAGNADASVSWTAPSSDGGSAITGYTVVASPGGASVTVAGSARSATVSGLTNGTPYTFTVTASNAVGTGPASVASNAVTPTSVTTLISESFGTSAANFTRVSGGTWAVANGRYVLSSPASPSSSAVANANLSVHNTAITGDFTLTASGSTTATSSAWNDFSVVFGYRDASDYDYVSFNESNDGSTSGIFRVAGGVRTQLADITSLITAGTLYPIKVERQGTTIRAYRSGTLVASATDSTFTTGKVGFATNNDGATYDDLKVTQ